MNTKSWSVKKLISAGILLLILIIAIVGFADKSHHKKAAVIPETQSRGNTVAIAPSGMNYPAGWQEVSRVSPADKQAGVVSVAYRSKPNAEVILRVTSGPLPGNFNIKTLPAETITKLKANITGFNLVSDATLNLAHNQAVRITYTSPSGQTVYEYTEIIVPTTNNTFYLTLSAAQGDFQNLTGDANKINGMLASYVASHE